MQRHTIITQQMQRHTTILRQMLLQTIIPNQTINLQQMLQQTITQPMRGILAQQSYMIRLAKTAQQIITQTVRAIVGRQMIQKQVQAVIVRRTIRQPVEQIIAPTLVMELGLLKAQGLIVKPYQTAHRSSHQEEILPGIQLHCVAQIRLEPLQALLPSELARPSLLSPLPSQGPQ
jgi:hypothetical protein